MSAKTDSIGHTRSELNTGLDSAGTNRSTPDVINVDQYLEQRARQVNLWLDLLTPSESTQPERLHQAMRYSLLSGGKRLRPALVLSGGEAITGEAIPDAPNTGFSACQLRR